MTLLSLWLVAIIFSSLPIFGFGQYAIQYPGTWCFLNLHPENPVDAAYSITFAVLNLLLIGVMIICNIGVQCKRCMNTLSQCFVIYLQVLGIHFKKSHTLSMRPFDATIKEALYKVYDTHVLMVWSPEAI